VAQSENDPESAPAGDNLSDADFRSVGVATYAVPPGFCLDDASWLYAIDVSTWERQTHSAAPVLFEFDFDLDRDGTPDYAVYNRDISGLSSLSDGRNVTFVQNLATGDEEGWFATDHKTNSANTALYFCAEQMGLTLDDAFTPFDVAGFAVDYYTSGTTRDEVAFEANPGNERYYGFVDGDPLFAAIGAGGSEPFQVLDLGPTAPVPTTRASRSGSSTAGETPRPSWSRPATDHRPRSTARGPRHRRGPRRFREQAAG